MSDFVKQCVMQRLKWSAALIFGIIVPLILLFMVAGMASDNVPAGEIVLVALAALLGGMIGFALSLIQSRRFVRMIRRQEEMLGLTFGEEEFTPTCPKASRLNQHYQFSDNWYMCEGSWALHRLYIVKVTLKSTQHNIGRMYYVWVKTIDGGFERLQMESASDQKKFYAWWKAGRK